MRQIITIKSFNGLGDMLFATPSFRVIKEAYPEAEIRVNTNYPALLKDNPYVSRVRTVDEGGVFLGYDDPIHCKAPTKHHIMADWEIICKHYDLETEVPKLKPEIYCTNGKLPMKLRMDIGVQTHQKGHWFQKKSWPFFPELIKQVSYKEFPIRGIPWFSDVIDLIKFIAGLRLVICTEGGISHIARAVDTPAIVIYGGFADPAWNGYEEQINIVNPKSCSYCYNPHPCVSDYECMREITVDHVISKIAELIDG